jgi:hypothetical protein
MNAPRHFTALSPAQLQAQINGLQRSVDGLSAQLAEQEQIIQGLKGLGDLAGDGPRSDIGPIERYLQDAYNLRPEIVRTEQLEFTVQADDTGITETTPSQRIDPEFAFILRRIKGFASMLEGQGPLSSPFMTFNVDDQGRARNGVFRNPIRMSYLVNVDGSPAHDYVWDAFYVFQPGADVIVNWSFAGSIAANESAIWGVSLTGDVVRVRSLPGGALITDPSGRRR